jgi:hypothetical protein
LPLPVQGYRVVLVALGQEYTYHTNQDALIRLAGSGVVPTAP